MNKNTEAYKTFERIIQEHRTNRKETITLQDRAILTIYGAGMEVTAQLILVPGMGFTAEKVGENIEVHLKPSREIDQFHLLMQKGLVRVAPNGWTANTTKGNSVTLKLW